MVGYDGNLIEGGWMHLSTPEQRMLPFCAALELGKMRRAFSAYQTMKRVVWYRTPFGMERGHPTICLTIASEHAHNVRTRIRTEGLRGIEGGKPTATFTVND